MVLFDLFFEVVEVLQAPLRVLVFAGATFLTDSQLGNRGVLTIVEVDLAADIVMEQVAAAHEAAVHEAAGGLLGVAGAVDLVVVGLRQVVDEFVIGHILDVFLLCHHFLYFHI